jgi:hypothetical protein
MSVGHETLGDALTGFRHVLEHDAMLRVALTRFAISRHSSALA